MADSVSISTTNVTPLDELNSTVLPVVVGTAECQISTRYDGWPALLLITVSRVRTGAGGSCDGMYCRAGGMNQSSPCTASPPSSLPSNHPVFRTPLLALLIAPPPRVGHKPNASPQCLGGFPRSEKGQLLRISWAHFHPAPPTRDCTLVCGPIRCG